MGLRRLPLNGLDGRGAAVDDSVAWDGHNWVPRAAHHAGTGTHSTRIGEGAVANATNSIAHGYLAYAEAVDSIAIGVEASVLSSSAGGLALGRDVAVTGDYGVAVGYRAQANATEGVAVGRVAYANGANSTVIGAQARSNGQQGTAVGAYSHAGHDRSTAVGWGSGTTANDQMMLHANEVEVYRTNSDLGLDTSLVMRSPDGTRYRLVPPNGGGAATWVAA